MFKNSLDYFAQVGFPFCRHAKMMCEHISNATCSTSGPGFKALPLDQVIHGLSPLSDQGGQKVQHHPWEKRKIITHILCCLLWQYPIGDSWMMSFYFIHLWSWYGSSRLSWYTLLAWYSTFTLHVESWWITQHPSHAIRLENACAFIQGAQLLLLLLF